MNKKEIQIKRAILLSAKMRFWPEHQPIRETAIDRFVQYGLSIVDGETGLTIRELEAQLRSSLSRGVRALGRREIEESLKRLVEGGEVEITGAKHDKHFRHAETARNKFADAQAKTRATLVEVCGELFPDENIPPDDYVAPFLDCLSYVFSQLGRAYVSQITGAVGSQDMVAAPSLTLSIQRVLSENQQIDSKLFVQGTIRFFQEGSHPKYDGIKWNMAQNYYIMQIVGLDPHSRILSEAVFGNAIFYIDTNVLIDALEPAARNYRTFRAISEACTKLNAQMRVCQITLDELQRVVTSGKGILPKVIDSIPEEIADKINSSFWTFYRKELKESGSADIDRLFAVFDNPMAVLNEDYRIERIDDNWFDNASETDKVKQQMQSVQDTSIKFRNRPKSSMAASHDALLTEWVKSERQKTTQDIWIITLDKSLPHLPRMTSKARPLAITLDALLQWISPMAIPDDREADVAQIFAEAVKCQLLPTVLLFDMQDFLIFQSVDWSCRELPAEDVEACIQYFKVHASELDPSDPAHRERIARELNRFFVDPKRKFKSHMEQLEARVSGKEKELMAKDSKIASLETQMEAERQQAESDKLVRSARMRFMIVIAVGCVLFVGGVLLANHSGSGTNWLQRVRDLWFLPSLALPIMIVVGWFVIGKTRLVALGFPFNKVFKTE